MTLSIEEMGNGLTPDQDLAFAAKPDHPEMREGVSIWFYADNGEVGFPRFAIEATVPSWDNHGTQANIAFPDGRLLIGSGKAPTISPLDEDGRPTILGAGGLSFRCVEPFRRWTMSFDGLAFDGTLDQQLDGTIYAGGKRTQVKIDLDMTMVTPAWVAQNPLDTTGMTELEIANAAAMGLGHRSEHHFRANCVFEVDGQRREFTATGTRIKRQSIRRLKDFTGHCWQSALFPDGRAFGSLVYPPKPGEPGKFSFNDAVIYQDGRLVPAKVVDAVFLSRFGPDGDDVSLVIESEFGRADIAAKTVFTTYSPDVKEMGGLNLHQGGARYVWDGQEAYGMIERSSFPSLMTPV